MIGADEKDAAAAGSWVRWLVGGGLVLAPLLAVTGCEVSTGLQPGRPASSVTRPR